MISYLTGNSVPHCVKSERLNRGDMSPWSKRKQKENQKQEERKKEKTKEKRKREPVYAPPFHWELSSHSNTKKKRKKNQGDNTQLFLLVHSCLSCFFQYWSSISSMFRSISPCGHISAPHTEQIATVITKVYCLPFMFLLTSFFFKSYPVHFLHSGQKSFLFLFLFCPSPFSFSFFSSLSDQKQVLVLLFLFLFFLFLFKRKTARADQEKKIV